MELCSTQKLASLCSEGPVALDVSPPLPLLDPTSCLNDTASVTEVLMHQLPDDTLFVADSYLKSRIVNKTSRYYVMLDEVQYAISDEELRGHEPPRLYGVLNGLLRMRNVDVYVTGSNSKLLSSDVMTQFRGRGDEVRVRPLSFSEFMQGFEGDKYQG